MHTEAHLFSVPNDCLWYDTLWGPSQRVVTLLDRVPSTRSNVPTAPAASFLSLMLPLLSPHAVPPPYLGHSVQTKWHARPGREYTIICNLVPANSAEFSAILFDTWSTPVLVKANLTRSQIFLFVSSCLKLFTISSDVKLGTNNKLPKLGQGSIPSTFIYP